MHNHPRTTLSAGRPTGVTVSAVLAQFDGSWDVATLVSELFLTECPVQLDDVRVSVEAENAPELALAAHKIKGSVGVFGADAAVEAALRLEEAGKQSDFSEAVELYRRLEMEVTQVGETLALLAAERHS